MADKNNNHPVKVFQCGRVQATIWIDQMIIDNTLKNVHTIRIDRSYKKEKEDWVHTNSFFIEDLPKVALAANEAYKFLRLKSSENAISDNNADSEEVKEGNET